MGSGGQRPFETFPKIHPFWYRHPDMRFVQNFTPPDFQAKNFTPSILPNFNSYSDKNIKKWVKWRNIHSWQKVYTAPGSDCIDKSHRCRHLSLCLKILALFLGFRNIKFKGYLEYDIFSMGNVWARGYGVSIPVSREDNCLPILNLYLPQAILFNSLLSKMN